MVDPYLQEAKIFYFIRLNHVKQNMMVEPSESWTSSPKVWFPKPLLVVKPGGQPSNNNILILDVLNATLFFFKQNLKS